MRYPDETVAKVLGAAMIGIPHKLISKFSGVPVYTIRYWARGDREVTVVPDTSALPVLVQWMYPLQTQRDKPAKKEIP